MTYLKNNNAILNFISFIVAYRRGYSAEIKARMNMLHDGVVGQSWE
ncbi:13529_t:CDS:2 [Cetraspora pellucida]|uniref:13529_t:CDS:1 n=1 Tax=Cetraspora pellucida TaxID=1433469 RepID=A0A9N9H836_9GLOM|nr:13529_t:CDS:2 [Cetraspora pellucida]